MPSLDFNLENTTPSLDFNLNSYDFVKGITGNVSVAGQVAKPLIIRAVPAHVQVIGQVGKPLLIVLDHLFLLTQRRVLLLKSRFAGLQIIV